MFQLVIMILWLMTLFVVCFKYTKGSYFSPQLAFVGCFIPAVAYAFFFIKYWSLDFAWQTVATVLGGCTLFTAVSFVTSWVIDRAKPRIAKKRSFEIKTQGFEACTKWHLIAFALLQVITLVWTFVFMIQMFGNHDIVAAMSHFNDTNKFSDTLIELPSFLGKLRLLTFASGFVWAYMFVHSIVYKKQNYTLMRILILINFLLSIANTLSTGSRTEMVILLIGALLYLYTIYGKKNGWKIHIKAKHVLVAVAGAGAVVVLFKPLGNLLGRKITKNVFEYLGVYLSAELKNLDLFIREGNFGAPVGRWQTLIEVVNIIGNRFGMPELVHKFDLPFRHVNGHSLGNVATTFYAWLYDGGYLAVILFTIVMAVICQVLYRLASAKKNCQNKMSVFEMIYGYVFFTILFSFFSNKFYEHVFAGHFVYLVLFWILLKLYVEWFNIENVKKLYFKIKNSLKKSA